MLGLRHRNPEHILKDLKTISWVRTRYEIGVKGKDKPTSSHRTPSTFSKINRLRKMFCCSGMFYLYSDRIRIKGKIPMECFTSKIVFGSTDTWTIHFQQNYLGCPQLILMLPSPYVRARSSARVYGTQTENGPRSGPEKISENLLYHRRHKMLGAKSE